MIEVNTITAEEFREMDEKSRTAQIKAFEEDRSIKMPFTGFSKGCIINWNPPKESS